jgi:OmpA-OmpF porin, OOP family
LTNLSLLHFSIIQNMKKFYILLTSVMAVFVLSTGHAQNKPWRGAMGITVGTNQYRGELANDFYRFSKFNPIFGLNYEHYITKRLNVQGRLWMGNWSYESETSNTFGADVFTGQIIGKIKLRDADAPVWMPYVFGGVGFNRMANWTLEDRDGQQLYNATNGAALNSKDYNRMIGILPLGLGIQFKFNDRVFLNIDETFTLQGEKGWDGVMGNINDQMLTHSVGISFGLFSWNDTDNDGVGDKEDKCPGTPSIAKVDDFGCPIDSDKDGLADFEDVCPDLFGSPSAKGCPDADGDTFADSVDECPKIAGIAQFNGCPDTDGDGFTDAQDNCPTIKGEAKFFGCPDTDGDGVADVDDKCANTPKNVKVDRLGCPIDSDKDGIADHEDKCPNEAGIKANKGCPEVKEEVKELFKQALTGVKFETGKDVIKPESFAILDNVVKVMKENPSYKLKIAGHTDNVGDPAKNLDLSDRRAKAVQKYLIDHGVAANSIISAQGFGDKQPIGDNTTKEGKAQNRRVEFVVEF